MYQWSPAPIETDEKIKPAPSKSQTYKNKVSFGKDDGKQKINNITNLISKLHNQDDENRQYDDDNNFLQQQQQQQQVINSELNRMASNQGTLANQGTPANPVNSTSKSIYSNFDDSYKADLSSLYSSLPSSSNMNLDNNKLLTKLDYIVHLLEEQRSEKTNHITEELILYLFLGIFIIFVLDSFAKSSKYVR